MKKILLTFICIGMLISLLCACSNTTENVDDEQIITEETTVDAKSLISESKDLNEAFTQFVNLYEKAESTEEKEELENYMNEYFLEDLNGFYYYLRPEKAMMHIDSDNRTIYVKNKDEVYIVPYSEKELTDMGFALEDISQIKDSEIYKYHVSELETEKVKDEDFYKVKVVFKSDYVGGDETNAFNSMRIICYSSREPMAYCSYGYFADEQDYISDSDREYNRGAVRDYFRDEDTTFSQKAERDENEKDWGKPKEKAEPAIGMTKDEVLNSSWGSPDKKNIDEYSWGTEEQWVYDGKGYIYFEGDKVTSIQHR